MRSERLTQVVEEEGKERPLGLRPEPTQRTLEVVEERRDLREERVEGE